MNKINTKTRNTLYKPNLGQGWHGHQTNTWPLTYLPLQKQNTTYAVSITKITNKNLLTALLENIDTVLQTKGGSGDFGKIKDA